MDELQNILSIMGTPEESKALRQLESDGKIIGFNGTGTVKPNWVKDDIYGSYYWGVKNANGNYDVVPNLRHGGFSTMGYNEGGNTLFATNDKGFNNLENDIKNTGKNYIPAEVSISNPNAKAGETLGLNRLQFGQLINSDINAPVELPSGGPMRANISSATPIPEPPEDPLYNRAFAHTGDETIAKQMADDARRLGLDPEDIGRINAHNYTVTRGEKTFSQDVEKDIQDWLPNTSEDLEKRLSEIEKWNNSAPMSSEQGVPKEPPKIGPRVTVENKVNAAAGAPEDATKKITSSIDHGTQQIGKDISNAYDWAKNNKWVKRGVGGALLFAAGNAFFGNGQRENAQLYGNPF